MILGNKNTIELVKNSRPGNPSVLVSLEALGNLPDLYDAQVTQVTFVPPKDDKNPGDFSPVGGGKYMPSVDLMNRMSEARGISGMDMSIVEPLYEDIDWNIMTRNDKDPPTLVRYLVGYRCTKQGKVLAEDGTDRISDPCTVIYNAWERVCELFTKEEMYTETYTQPSKYGYKYDTAGKRRAAFASEMKFAERKADSKARTVVVRTLCGMPTGYDGAQLVAGYFIIAKVMRSAWAVKSEHAARLQALSHGVGDQSASKLLYGQTTGQQEQPQADTDGLPEPCMEQEGYTMHDDLVGQALEEPAIKKPVTRDVMIRALNQYKTAKFVQDENAVNNLLTWLNGDANAEKNERYWAKALSVLTGIEAKVPEALRVR